MDNFEINLKNLDCKLNFNIIKDLTLYKNGEEVLHLDSIDMERIKFYESINKIEHNNNEHTYNK